MSFRTFSVFSLLLFASASWAAASSTVPEKAPIMSQHARGHFEVKMTPQAAEPEQAALLARFALVKQFHGDLEAEGKGQMLTGGTSTKGSAGYVALEQVSGKLGGRNGTFLLQHSGTMNRGAPQLSITVVPDSGTDALVGLSGKLEIRIEGGQHFYDFEYTLPAAQ